MQTHDPAPHFQNLVRALGTKIGTEVAEQDLREEFQKYLDYGVPADQAVRTLIRHYGGQPAVPRGPVSQERIPLAQLPPESPSVNLKVRLLSLNTKQVTARGEAKTILWGLLGDESGTAPYTAWRPLEGLEKGDVIEVQGAYTKTFNNQVQANFGDRTRLTKMDAASLPPTPTRIQDVRVADIAEGMRGLRVSGRILSVAERQVQVQGQPRSLWGGTLADASGAIEFTSWHDFGLKTGDAVTIEGGYVRAFRSVPQLNFDQGAKVTPFTGDLPPAQALSVHPPMAIGRLLEKGGASDVTLVGTLLEVRPGSGLVLRCGHKEGAQSCGRVLTAGQCRLHAKQDGAPDLRIKAMLDDGTGAVGVIVGREATVALLGKSLEACIEEAKAAFRPEIIQDQLRERLTGRLFAARGNALTDDYGMQVIARSFTPFQEDVAAGAQALLGEIGGA
ncbi:MAG TPA: hypothetical protein VI796_06535 [Candidatus Thermoplasmatota archaeon]|nr:hypothetical protein [Candidatus Thermoplasmatota archaeon]